MLDTHAFLWMVTGGPFSETAAAELLEPQNQLFLSAASYWEISIKVGIGKLQLQPNWAQAFDDVIVQNTVHWLDIDKASCQRQAKLPFHHRDPFDRLLIAQAVELGMKLMTNDKAMSAYPVDILW